jgi:hypothetical protein
LNKTFSADRRASGKLQPNGWHQSNLPIPHDPARAKQLLAQAGLSRLVQTRRRVWGRFIRIRSWPAIAGQLTRRHPRQGADYEWGGTGDVEVWSNPLALLAWGLMSAIRRRTASAADRRHLVAEFRSLDLS